MKSVLCKIGYHDWEIIDSKKIEEIETEYNEKNFTEIEFDIDKYRAYNKICMRCNKKKNEIEEFNHRIFQLDRRHQIALERYERED